jgi:hypothetical protein
LKRIIWKKWKKSLKETFGESLKQKSEKKFWKSLKKNVGRKILSKSLKEKIKMFENKLLEKVWGKKCRHKDFVKNFETKNYQKNPEGKSDATFWGKLWRKFLKTGKELCQKSEKN